MRKPESSIKMSTARLVQLTIGGNFQYTANMWPTITQRAAIPRRPSRYPIWVKVGCFIIRSIRMIISETLELFIVENRATTPEVVAADVAAVCNLIQLTHNTLRCPCECRDPY